MIYILRTSKSLPFETFQFFKGLTSVKRSKLANMEENLIPLETS